jgi:hypothetical protein
MKFLSDNKVMIIIMNLYMAHYLYPFGADKQLYMESEIKGKLYHWSAVFDSSRTKLQQLIKKGVDAFKRC